jgi:RNA polymerase sigma-70 factor (ECF subfamily)
MKSRARRSTGVTPSLTVPAPARTIPGALDVEALYRSSRDDVYAYVATLLRDRAAAEDVTALAFERAMRRQRSYRPGRGSPRAWLFGIARHAALDELRRRRRTAELAADVPDAGPSPDEDAELALRRAAVRSALRGLDARDRELIGLRFHAGLSHQELAGVLGVSETNAGTQLHRAMQRLRKACDATS